jgi:hypothetical protein
MSIGLGAFDVAFPWSALPPSQRPESDSEDTSHSPPVSGARGTGVQVLVPRFQGLACGLRRSGRVAVKWLPDACIGHGVCLMSELWSNLPAHQKRG